ncbi:MAG: SPFH domain-containing protein [Eggerthellaceae bacterium]|nr:SPFH domain-containing protein [Eggerthellaceae bacterium]
MGLIKAASTAVSSQLGDQWKEYIYCDSLSTDTLVVKGQKRVSGRSSNVKGEENIISNGSAVAVNEGQCMIIVQQGEVVEVCAEPGEFIFDKSTEPSVFTGSLGKALGDTVKIMWRRLTFGGDTGKDQRVYYVNTKEILGNKYGTTSPVPFRVVDKNIGLDVDIALRCNGEFSYRIVNPLLFYKNVCGNIEAPYMRSQIDSQLRAELLTALQPAFSKLSEAGIRYSAIPAHTMELSESLNRILSESWTNLRGINIVAFGVNSIAASEEDEDMIKELQKAAVLRDPSMAAANIAAAQSDAMRTAAANENGAMMGFMGMGMANAIGGMNAPGLFAQGNAGFGGAPANQYAVDPSGGFAAAGVVATTPAPAGWACECGQVNTGKFCSNCGKPNPTWVCECGKQNTGNFCSECGKKRP